MPLFSIKGTGPFTPRKTYTREFKIEAVRLMAESDRPSSELAAELGIRRNQLYKGALGSYI